jgi:ectoine hydroxylase-related dioxygenase (phytanoyl-CoA dioxygenase family)
VQQRDMHEYKLNGHTLLPGLCSAQEIQAVRPYLLHVAQSTAEESNDFHRRTYNAWQKCPTSREFILSARLAHTVAQLMEVSSVRLYMDQVFQKVPRTGQTGWHIDGFNVPFNTSKLGTLWIPLDEVTPENGAVVYVSGGVHGDRLGLPNANAGDWVDQNFDDLELVDYGGHHKLGDAMFHRGDVIHKAEPNDTPRTRTVLALVFVADGEPVVRREYVHKMHRNLNHFFDRPCHEDGNHQRLIGKYMIDRQWLSEQCVGHVVETPFVPLVSTVEATASPSAAVGQGSCTPEAQEPSSEDTHHQSSGSVFQMAVPAVASLASNLGREMATASDGVDAARLQIHIGADINVPFRTFVTRQDCMPSDAT